MALVSAMAAAAPSVSAFAATTYTPVAGTSTTFDKYLVMDKDAEVPNAAFQYTITAGTASTYDLDGKKFEILAGVGSPTIAGVDSTTAGEIKFTQGDGSDADSKHASTDQVKGTLTSDQKYAKKTATIDFSKCQFTEPGVYRYVLTESGTNQGITNDEDLTRTLDVYVTDDKGSLKVSAYILHASDNDITMGSSNGTTDTATADSKPQGFTNVYDTSDLVIRKQVTGNQASHDKYFEFTVTISNAQPGTQYDVVLDDADATTGTNDATISANEGKTNPAKLTVGADGTVTQKFYLQHNQQITIQGIAKDSKYTVTENKEDYKSTANTAASPVVTTCAGTSAADTAGTIESTDLTTGYLNTRKGVIPTGVVLAVGPAAAAAILGGAGAVTFVMKKKKDEE